MFNKQKITPPKDQPNINQAVTIEDLKAEKARKIKELKERLAMVESESMEIGAESNSVNPLPNVDAETPLPPKFKTDNQQEEKIKVVPISFEELVSIQYDEIKSLLLKLEARLGNIK